MSGGGATDIISALELSAVRYPEKVAYRILGVGLEERESITFAVLLNRVVARARRLVARGLRNKAIVLPQPTTLNFVIDFFAALAAGAVVVPINTRLVLRPEEGLYRIVRDAGAVALLADPATAERFERSQRRIGADLIDVIVTSDADADDVVDLPGRSAADLAVIQYTSGSTSEPKGVCISHENLVANANLLIETFGFTEQDCAVSWLPLFHDMGLMAGVVCPAVVGASGVLMRPSVFTARPASWLQAVSRYGGTVSSAPNFAYQLCADVVQAADLEKLDLSSWKTAICGAEPVRAQTVEHFVQRFAAAGFSASAFYPCYGLAEATVFVAGGRDLPGPRILAVDGEALTRKGVVQPPGEGVRPRRLVSCGRVGKGLDLVVVDPESRRLLENGHVGEIWIRGSSVASGYYGLDEATRGVFSGRVADRPQPNSGGSYLRTGDLGLLLDGELFVIGRTKDMIIVRGAKHYPQDLELTCSRCDPALAGLGGAAFAMEDCEPGEVVIVHEIDGAHQQRTREVIKIIHASVARAHGLSLDRIVIIPKATLPRTTSGKVRRCPTREAWLAGNLVVVDTWSHGGMEAESA